MNILFIILGSLMAVLFFYFITAYRKMNKMGNAPDNEKIKHLNQKNYTQITKNGISLIDFWAGWCMPCKMMAPVLNDIANEVDGNVNICKINVESEQQLASKFGVQNIPTLLLLKNGKEINRFVGVKPKEYLIKQIALAK